MVARQKAVDIAHEQALSGLSGEDGDKTAKVPFLRLFGPMQLWKAGNPVALPASRKARGLLAYLVMVQRPILRTRLCEVFWEIPNDPRGELRWCLSKLRRVLDDGPVKRIHADREYASIDASRLEVDALKIEREAEEALAGADVQRLAHLSSLLADDFLDGFGSERDPLFQVWLYGQRERYRTFDARLQRRIGELLPDLSEGRLAALRRLAERRWDDVSSQQAFLTELARLGRVSEGDAYVVATMRLLKGSGLNASSLERAWQSVKQHVAPDPIALVVAHEIKPSVPTPPEAPPRSMVTGAERRQVTALQCDLEYSNRGSTPLDPEDLLETFSAHELCCQEAIARFGGSIVTRTTDGVLAYFGYPQGYEDSAERALRAALQIVHGPTPTDIDSIVQPRARVGIATGLVLIKRPANTGALDEPTIVGDAPKIAMTLRAFAGAGQILISEATLQLVGNAFSVALKPMTVRSGQTETAAWQVLGVDERQGRFQSHRAGALSPLIGRDEELQFLNRRWDECLDGDGQAAILSGEAGIGKSRLVLAFHELVAGQQQPDFFFFFCSPLHQASMLHPFRTFLQRAAGVDLNEDPDQKLKKLSEYLNLATITPAADLPYLAELLSIPEGSFSRPDMNPSRRRERTLEALLHLVELAATRNAVLLVVEDVHWIDPTSLELVARIVERLPQLRVLLVITGRPEFQSPWNGNPHVRTLAMNRLRPRDGVALIRVVAGGKALPAAIVDEIVAKTDGVPLFVEEVTKVVLQSDLLVETGDAYSAGVSKHTIVIPTSIQDSLTARLDRLVEGKTCAQFGAVIGREFSYRLLRGIVDTRARFDAALVDLERAQLVLRRGTPPVATYYFKHALVQEAAYESLLRRERQAIHLRIAEMLRDHPDDTGASEPETIAHHFKQAGQADDAVIWLVRAGQRALENSACREAIDLFEDAIAIADGRPDTPENRRERVRLQTSYGLALMAGKGYGDPQTVMAFAHARKLADDIADPAERFLAYYGLWVGSYVRSEAANLWDLAEQCLQLTADRPVSSDASVAHRLCGATLWLRGDYAGARIHLERAVAIYESCGEVGAPFRFGQDIGVSAYYYLAFVLWSLGDIDRACDLASRGLQLALDLNHLPSIVYAYHHQCGLEAIRVDAAGVFDPARMMVSLSGKHGFPYWQSWGSFLFGWARCHKGEGEVGTSDMERARDSLDAQGITVWMPMIVMAHAEGVAHVRGARAALDILATAKPALRRSGESWFDAELHRLRGELLLACEPPEPVEAEAEMKQALAIAQRQGTRMFELHAAISLARFYRASRREGAALAPLREALLGFDPQSNVPEIRTALDIIESVADG